MSTGFMALNAAVGTGGDRSTADTPPSLSALHAQSDIGIASSTPASQDYAPPAPATGMAAQKPLPTTLPSHASKAPVPDIMADSNMDMGTESVSAGSPAGQSDDMTASTSDVVKVEGTDSTKPKKKTHQKFHCTEFPPCTLSFTRSEHLARHIRKHTGERPFQCHCLRFFTRLDNLRQHAQTVHQDEQIPDSSLASHSTRYQRHVRSGRIRGSGRPRSSTTGSVGGHSRNLSTSSLASTSSYFSQADDIAPRPPHMTDIAPPRPQFEGSYRSPPTSPYRASSPVLFGSQGNPHPVDRQAQILSGPFASGHTRGSSMSSVGPLGPRGHNRRLSFPTNPLQANNSHQTAPVLPPLSSTSTQFGLDSRLMESPTSSAFSSRRGSFSSDSAPQPDPRRRTWHPSSFPNRPPTLGSDSPLTMTPHRLSQNFSHPNPVRLPPIESLLNRPMTPVSIRRPMSPIRREPSPMEIDVQTRSAVPNRSWEMNGPSRAEGNSPSIERGLQQTMTRLEISSRQQNNPPHPLEQSSTWPLRGHHARHHSDLGYIPQSVQPNNYGPPPYMPQRRPDYSDRSGLGSEAIQSKRQAMYFGPGGLPTASPEGSNSSDGPVTPSNASEYQPSIRNSGSWLEQNPSPLVEEVRLAQASQIPDLSASKQPPVSKGPPRSHRRTDSDMLRLEALVEAASRENGS